MKTLIALILLLAIGAGAYWYFADAQHQREVQRAQNQAAKRTEEMADAVKERLKDMHLSGPEIRQEIERTGKVVRKKAGEVGATIADATADARMTAAIKAKFVKDPKLSAFKTSVNTTDGVVTISGSVTSPEDISRAVNLAMETDGVREVISTLQVKAEK